MRVSFQNIIVFILLTIIGVNVYSQEEYEWGSLPLGGGGFVSGIIAHPTERNLLYARTDVGGIYRWIEETASWKPLTDFISEADKGLYGVEAIALDPQKPEMLYALVGTSYFSGGKTAILISKDYGETYKVVDVTSKFKAHGNGDGRQMGERLAVDPHNSNIIYCGSRSNGLFKSTDAGLTWNKVSFPVTTTSNGVGINFVQFDESSTVSGGATQKIYVGTAQTGSSIYVSTDGGISWSAIAGQPTTFIPHRCAMKNGVLYVTYANGAGPGISTAGGYVYKYNGSWTNISPSSKTSDFSYGGISIVGNRIVVTSVGCYKMQSWDGKCDWQTATWGDEIFVSDNLGASWSALFSNCKVNLDANSVPWVKDHAMHWTGCATLDPFNANRAFFISGNGLFMTENLNTTKIDLKFCVKGLEETVPLDIVSLSTGQVVTVVGDYDGGLYVANDGNYDSYPATVHTPEMHTTHGIAAAVDGSLLVRAGSQSSYVQYSTDKGKTWKFCSGGKEGSGHVAVSADGSIILHCPNTSNGYSYDGSGNKLYYSTDRGTSWTQCNGVSINGAYPVADGANPKTFYVTNGSTVYVSTDGGKNFSAKGTTGSSSYYKIRTVPGVAGDVWAPCGSNGLYRSTNSATSFTKNPKVSSCAAVGFGKAAPGKTFPAVFIWGTVSGIEGLFRSDDEGTTWIRINDDLHQFGGPGNGQFVVGDMAVYGNVIMSTVGRGAIYGKMSVSQCAKVSLGPDKSICGLDEITLNSGTKANTNVTYSWYKNDVLIAGETKPTLTVTTSGTYKVVRDSATCSKSDEVVVAATLPEIDLGPEKNLCEETSFVLDAGVSSEAYSYQWKKDNVVIAGETNKTFVAKEAATYTCVVSAANCDDVMGNVVVTSDLLDVVVEPVCKNGGESSMEVMTVGGPYEWYAAETGGEPLQTGNVYAPTISENTTYYVQDAGASVSSFGIAEYVDGVDGWSTNTLADASSQVAITVDAPCTLQSFSVKNNSKATIVVNLKSGSDIAYTKTIENVPAGFNEISLGFNLAVGTYIVDLSESTFADEWGGLFLQTSGVTNPISLPGYVSVQPAPGSWLKDGPVHFYNWTIKVGSSCARTPVTATIDMEKPCSSVLEEQEIALKAGWNAFSLSVVPENKSVPSVLAGVDYKIVKNNDGFYSPAVAEELQSLSTIDAGEGYLIYVNKAATLHVQGTAIEGFSSSLRTGWNLVGVPVTGEVPVSSLPASIMKVTDYSGKAVSVLKSGEAYFMQVTSDIEITW
ncbi:MAG: hypothetical protein MJ197_02795 [Bacteroidales bacterium]|nr:hypothetical protein [Bacteroidales bacterium]